MANSIDPIKRVSMAQMRAHKQPELGHDVAKTNQAPLYPS